ncbi:MAG: hypothetical protein A3G33_02265 [Omnitrophica bacterium RIFCSPLOWO2_12_FULL_44_17]|uniref:Haloacid dehalogenase n=1 Tax=Candidatus Danuiimicrobium aquiferis TaxID=1801832 RepID=A0A1G1L2Y6_9BACT|nr:MAG: hypothetical protein A3B72_08780 [Omnitrophica bacterium RIFCSPHIGHO2_02_FULL_45_28]OGW91385.1 MAG: hypothetical protein A3E74_08855 [Omnitrophica bacterium RIFCSPHIGHO2_12_FULL_44_12]OGW99239.1 MAG: hypothetical protein A3G33_02265 [Omnitrophica bacterium RIFCSPLOWO2_12_FULL_44_17]OGX03194.1 MAG: hypothetical protein A3J12_02550 [Omnitrophica bacterium RIFCSPLOWO2_02_FULL_44_11]
MIKAIIFDLGNVLINYDPSIPAREFAKLSGKSEDEIFRMLFSSNLEDLYTRGQMSSEEFVRKMKALFGVEVDDGTFITVWNEIFFENEGMEALVRLLKKHYALYMISNTNDLHWNYLVERYSVFKHFIKCYPSHEVGMRKPDPKIYEHVLHEIHLKPEEAIFIDDMPHFVEGARRVGIRAVQFTSRETLEKDLRDLGIEW